MAFYAYKHVLHAWPHDMVERWEAREGREFDDDFNRDGDGWLVASMWINELIEASSKRDAEIAQLRADLARVTAERDEARAECEAVLSALEDFGWDLAVLRVDTESERLAETVKGCTAAAIARMRRALRANAKGGTDADA